MGFKRKRNLKVENDVPYRVCKPEELDASFLEHYCPTSIDTGMEADEEREIHLKSIIDSGKGDIPLPVIEVVDSPTRSIYGKFLPAKRFTKWSVDAINEYFLSAEDTEFCIRNNLSEDAFLAAHKQLEENSSMGNIDGKLRDYILQRVLIRQELLMLPSYVCFRRRVLQPARKSRRNESQALEKLRGLWTEMWYLQKLSELSTERNSLEKELIDTDTEIHSLSSEILRQCDVKHRRKIIKFIKGVHKNEMQDTGYGSCAVIGELMRDRVKIRSLRKRLNEFSCGNDMADIEMEANALKSIFGKYKW